MVMVVAVPLEGTRKVYTGEETERKTVKIFGKSKNLFSNGGNPYAEYDTIILGYPNWWASIPMPIATLLESYDFSGKTIMPFSSA